MYIFEIKAGLWLTILFFEMQRNLKLPTVLLSVIVFMILQPFNVPLLAPTKLEARTLPV